MHTIWLCQVSWKNYISVAQLPKIWSVSNSNCALLFLQIMRTVGFTTCRSLYAAIRPGLTLKIKIWLWLESQNYVISDNKSSQFVFSLTVKFSFYDQCFCCFWLVADFLVLQLRTGRKHRLIFARRHWICTLEKWASVETTRLFKTFYSMFHPQHSGYDLRLWYLTDLYNFFLTMGTRKKPQGQTVSRLTN